MVSFTTIPNPPAYGYNGTGLLVPVEITVDRLLLHDDADPEPDPNLRRAIPNPDFDLGFDEPELTETGPRPIRYESVPFVFFAQRRARSATDGDQRQKSGVAGTQDETKIEFLLSHIDLSTRGYISAYDQLPLIKNGDRLVQIRTLNPPLYTRTFPDRHIYITKIDPLDSFETFYSITLIDDDNNSEILA